MKISSSFPASLALVCSILCACDRGTPPAEADATTFEVLFDGTDLEGWKHSGNWTIEADGAVSRTGKGGGLVYAAKPIPDDFELRFEWKVAPGSNSGVYYRPTQYEYQVLDNAGHKDGGNPRTSAASLYFCMQPSRDATKPVGQWNTARILCKGTVVQHWLNEEKVVGFDYMDPAWDFHTNLLKKRGGDLNARGASLSLQDHGDAVWYRNILLRELGPNDAIDETPVKPETIPPAILAEEKVKLEGIIAKRAAQKEKAAAEAAAQSKQTGTTGQKPETSSGAKPKKMPRAKVKS
jgi:hypothetical protein